MALQVGQPAPDFTLVNTEMKPISLAAYRGQPVVLLFFPLAFSSVCTAELCQVRDNFEQYRQLNAQIIGISVDSLFSLAKFKQEQALHFELLSDFNKEVSEAYGALYTEFYGMKGVSKRAAFVIGPEGTIRYAEVLDDAEQQPDFGQLVQTLERIPLSVS